MLLSSLTCLIVFARGSTVTPVTSAPFQPIPPRVEQMLTLYRKLMNDMELVKSGNFGAERIPGDPSFMIHWSREMGGPLSAEQRAIRALRQEVHKERAWLGDGLLSLGIHPATKSNIRYWNGYAVRPVKAPLNQKQLHEAAPAIVRAVQKTPDKTYSSKVGEAMVYARAIRFEHSECLSCHKDKKLNSVAAVAVVAVPAASK